MNEPLILHMLPASWMMERHYELKNTSVLSSNWSLSPAVTKDLRYWPDICLEVLKLNPELDQKSGKSGSN